jgi:hypothetical protein
MYAAHAEREQRLELDAFLVAVVAQEAERGAFRAAQARPHARRDRAREMLDLVVDAPRRVAGTDHVEDGLTADDAIAVRARSRGNACSDPRS